MSPAPAPVPPPASKGQRHHLTVLFTDLCGSTELGRQLEMEQYAELMAAVRAVWHAAAKANEGLVLRTQGDGAVIVFGYPQAGEFDGLRAAEAALQIHAGLAAMPLHDLPLSGPLQARSGLHAGVLLVAPGDEARGHFDLTGDVVNTAGKLEKAALPGEILATRQALGANAGMLELQTHGQPEVTRVLGRSALRRRFDATAQRGLTPLWGRDEVLHSLLAFLHADTGPCNALVTAAAGLGKTRLLEELAVRAAADERVWVLRGSCERTLGSEVLQPFAQMLHTLMGRSAGPTTDGDGASPVHAEREAIAKALASGNVDLYRDVFVHLGGQAPLLLMLDDWQWADDASRRLLQALTETQPTPNAPQSARSLRMLLAARPQDDGTPWLGDALQVELRALNAHETAEVVHRWLPDADPFLVQRIHDFSGGVPLFIEELCHLASADGLSQALEEQSAARQSWIAALVAARVQNLSEPQAKVLRAAAVIGQDVPLPLLRGTSEAEPDPALLLGLAEADFLYPHRQGERLQFKHGITHEAVYETIGLQERRRLHQRVLQALQGDEGQKAPEALAHHSWGAGLWAPAAEHAERAGDKSATAFAMDRARQHYRTALQALERLEQSTGAKLGGGASAGTQDGAVCRVSAKAALACVFDPLSLGNDVTAFERAVVLARRMGDANAEARALYWLGYLRYALGHFNDARDQVRRALAMSRSLDDAPLTTQIEATLGQILVGTCDYDEALQLMGAAVAAKRERARPGSGMAVGSAYTLACIGSVHADRGDFNAAHDAFDEAVRLLGDTTHPVGNSARNWIAVALISEGQWARAQRVARESVRIAEGTHTLLLLAVSRSTLAYARWRESGEDEAVRQLEQAVGWMAARNGRMFTGLHSSWLAEACVATGRDTQARQLAAHVLRRARQGERQGEGIACRAMARLAHRNGQAAVVQRWLSRAQASADARQSCRETALNETLRAELC